MRLFIQCYDALLMCLVACEKIYVSRSKCWYINCESIFSIKKMLSP